MGLRINTNVASLNAQRNLNSTSKALGRSLERLSSGSRINRAGDDAAGLAISEGLQAQVRGLRQAVRNGNDSLGFLNTAEGALGEITNITQRLRELAIQAANGAIGNKERGFLDDEMEALLEEFNRIAVQTEFNGTKLLNGSFVETDLQIGVNKGETISFTIGDARTTSLGALAIVSGAQNVMRGTAGITLGAGDAQSTVTASSSSDAVSTLGNSVSSIAVAAAVNSASGTTGITADVQDTVVKINNIDATALDTALQENDFVINGIDIVGSAASVDDLVDLVNDFSSSTGVKARLASGSTDDIELVAADGRNIAIEMQTSAAFLYSAFDDGANVQNTTNGFNVLFAGSAVSAISSGGIVVSTTVAGSNGLFTGAVELRSADTILVSGTSASLTLGFSDTAIAVDSSTSINSIDISTQSNAQDALQTVDATLSQLNELRASLGAVQNRLESTIRNLSIGLENISSAQSQIRDADIAAETAELTRGQILQQAGVAVLGQANTSAQVALSLLQF